MMVEEKVVLAISELNAGSFFSEKVEFIVVNAELICSSAVERNSPLFISVMETETCSGTCAETGIAAIKSENRANKEIAVLSRECVFEYLIEMLDYK